MLFMIRICAFGIQIRRLFHYFSFNMGLFYHFFPLRVLTNNFTINLNNLT